MANATTFVDGIIREIVNPLVAVLFAAAMVVFFWGLIQLIYSADESGGKETGKQHMLWGVVGIFIMLSAYGILKLFTNTFGISIP